jgi:hypothetical protein
MQSKCPKCNGIAFRMLPETAKATEVECLNCGQVTPFHVTITSRDNLNQTQKPAAE